MLTSAMSSDELEKARKRRERFAATPSAPKGLVSRGSKALIPQECSRELARLRAIPAAERKWFDVRRLRESVASGGADLGPVLELAVETCVAQGLPELESMVRALLDKGQQLATPRAVWEKMHAVILLELGLINEAFKATGAAAVLAYMKAVVQNDLVGCALAIKAEDNALLRQVMVGSLIGLIESAKAAIKKSFRPVGDRLEWVQTLPYAIIDATNSSV